MQDIQIHNINELLGKLTIREEEIPLYESLLSLDYNFFYPIIMGVLMGQINITDFTVDDPYQTIKYPPNQVDRTEFESSDPMFQQYTEYQLRRSDKQKFIDKFVSKNNKQVINDVTLLNTYDYTIDKIRRLYNMKKVIDNTGVSSEELQIQDAGMIFQEVKNVIVNTILGNIKLTNEDYNRIYNEGITELDIKKEKQRQYFFLLNQSYTGIK